MPVWPRWKGKRELAQAGKKRSEARRKRGEPGLLLVLGHERGGGERAGQLGRRGKVKAG